MLCGFSKLPDACIQDSLEEELTLLVNREIFKRQNGEDNPKKHMISILTGRHQRHMPSVPVYSFLFLFGT